MNTELETLVIKLVGDVDGLVKDFDRTKAAVNDLSKKVDEGFKKSEESAKSFGQTMNSLTASITTALGAFGAQAWLRQGLANFQEAELIGLKLSASLQANGRDVDKLTKDYNDFAQQLEKTTTAEDDQILSLLQSAEAMGVTGENAKRAVKNALALEAAGRGSAQGVIRLTAALEKGSTQGLDRFLRAELAGVKEGDKLAKAHDVLAKKFGLVEAQAKSSSGLLMTLSRDYNNLLKDFGKIVAEGIAPVVKWLKELVQWFRNLDDTTKTVIVSVAAVTAGVLAAIAAVSAALVVFNALSGGVLLLVGVLVTAGVAVGVWIGQIGGVGKAWEQVQQAGMTAWEWLLPIRLQLANVWDAVSDGAIFAWESVKQAAADAWTFVFGEAEINWSKVRDVVTEALIYVEFALRNIVPISEYVWTGVKLYAVKAFETISHFFKSDLPALLRWFQTNLPAIVEAVFDYIGTVSVVAVTNLITLFKNIPWDGLFQGVYQGAKFQLTMTIDAFARTMDSIQKLLTGEISIDDIWAEPPAEIIASQVTDGLKKLPTFLGKELTELRLPPRTLSQLEKDLQDEFDVLGDDLGRSFEEFKADRLWEIALYGDDKETKDKPKNEAGKLGMDMGNKLVKGAMSEVKKLDAVLVNSAEDVSRIADYFDRLRYGTKEARGGPASGKFAVAATGADANDQWERQEELLGKINGTLERIERNSENDVSLDGADL